MGVGEEKVGVLGSINNNLLRCETPVVGTTEDVLVRVNIEIKVRVIHHFFSESVIEEHRLKSRCKWNVFVSVSTLMVLIESWFVAIRAQFGGFIVDPYKCTTAVDTAVIHFSLDI